MTRARLPDPPAARGDAILERLTRLHPKLIDLTLGRTERLLARLGHPERRLPPVVHIAGTNGKGSTLAFMRAGLEAAGYRVHVYISPHLVRFNERIRLAGRLIGDDALIDALERGERANDGEPITFFEITTAVAFLAFAETPADILLLETGLGGTADSTNVIARPLLTAISPISYDHQRFLGDSLGEIAANKAGILKPGVTGVIARQPPAAMAVIDARAGDIGAPLLRRDTDWRIETVDGGLRFEIDGKATALPPSALPGAHQPDNAGLALACLARLDGFDIDDRALAAAMTDVDWPARLQRLTDGPLAELLPAGTELWLDGGHNPAAAELLADTLSRWPPRPLHLVVGMMNGKDCRNYLERLAPLSPQVRGIAIPGEANSLTADAIVAIARDVGLPAAPAMNADDALSRIAAATANRPARVMICGSLYLAGAILAASDAQRPG